MKISVSHTKYSTVSTVNYAKKLQLRCRKCMPCDAFHSSARHLILPEGVMYIQYMYSNPLASAAFVVLIQPQRPSTQPVMYYSPQFPFKKPDFANAYPHIQGPLPTPSRSDQGFPLCCFDRNLPVYETSDVIIVSTTGPIFDQETPVQDDRE